MDLVLKSALSKREQSLLQIPKVLLFYAERGFLSGTMELMRIAASKISVTTPLNCAIWDFEFVAEPLLMRVAAREIMNTTRRRKSSPIADLRHCAQ